MKEKPKIIIDDDDIEILDFDDDIAEESPEIEEIIIEDVEPIQEQVIFPVEEKKDNNQEITESPIIQEKPEEPIQDELEISVIEEQTPKKTEIENKEHVSNTDLLNHTLRLNKSDLIDNNTDNDEHDKVNKNILSDRDSVKEVNKTIKKGKIKWKSVILGIFIFAMLFGAIIALPFISNYVHKKELNKQNNSEPINNISSTNEEFRSNIDVKKALNGIKDYRNYQYQNINAISTKDNTEQLISIKNNYVYSFNETKFEVYINKIVADFSYEIKDYYEKLNDDYNLYINDITTKTYTKKNTAAEEFDRLISVFPNMINYLINNYNVSEEKLLKVGNEEHIDITLKVSKDIVNNMSVETDRIQNKIDSTNLEQEFVYVDLLFDEEQKLYRIEIEIEDKNAIQEQLENTVESAILKYIFTDFNKTVDITIPEL